MALFKAYLFNIFDTELPETVTKTFVINNKVDQSLIFKHPATKLNVLFCHLWNYIFKTFPSCQQYNTFINEQQINLMQSELVIKGQMIDDFLNKLYILKLGLITKFNILEYSTFANTCIKKLDDIEFIKDTIIDKLQFRYDTKIDKTINLLTTFFNMNIKDKGIMETEDLPNINPITGFTLDIPQSKKQKMNKYQHQLHTINEDVYFMNKLMNYPTIVIDLNQPDDYQRIINETVRNITKANNKKCVVISEFPVDVDCYQYNLIKSIYRYIPSICPWFLLMTDNCTPTSLKGKAIQSTNNVVLYFGNDYKDKPNGYNRVISVDDISSSYFKLYNTVTFWKYHIKHENPETATHATHNSLLFIDFIYKYAAKYCKNIPNQQDKSKNLILLIDNRENDLSVISCKCALINTKDWHCRVITSKKSEIYYTRQLPQVQIQTHPLLDNEFDIDVYNTILEDIELWKSLEEDGYENVLIIQDDGIMVRPGIEKFMKYDYVGAPWADIPDNIVIKETITSNMVGNGGFSLRKVKTTIKCLEQYADKKLETFYHNINRIPEDVYFVKWLTKMGAEFPTIDEASLFSTEQIINPKNIGFHKFWVYHPYHKVKEVFNSILDGKTT